ncbi:MAG TPA: ADYC domain-containing protein [Polyangia bacterium]
MRGNGAHLHPRTGGHAVYHQHLLVLTMLMAAGCSVDEIQIVDTQTAELRIGAPDEYWCPTEDCGLNGVSVGDGVAFDGLDLGGRVGDESFWYAGAWIEEAGTRTQVTISVSGDQLEVAGHPKLWTVAEENLGRALVLIVRHETGAEFELRLRQLGGEDYLAGKPGSAPGYRFLVRQTIGAGIGSASEDSAGVLSPLCRGQHAVQDVLDSGVEDWAFMFAGDRYDKIGKRVVPGEATRFHIACRGSVLAKMFLFRHTESGHFVWHWSAIDPPMVGVSSLAQRQALLKMFTADYCGDGHSFTVEGHPIDFSLANDWWKGLTPPLSLLRVEALWDSNGAVCLNQPRQAQREQVQAHCLALGKTLPACSDLDGWEQRGHALSAHLTHH